MCKNESEHIISLEESDSSDSKRNGNNLGAKSEIKSTKPNINLYKKMGNGNEKEKKGIKSESKIFTSMKKSRKEKEKLNDIIYHYFMNYESLYKYKLVENNEKGNIGKFSCDDKNCISMAEYDLINKIFIIKIWHSIPHNEHSYIKDFKGIDPYIYNYMKKFNMYDLDITMAESKRLENL